MHNGWLLGAYIFTVIVFFALMVKLVMLFSRRGKFAVTVKAFGMFIDMRATDLTKETDHNDRSCQKDDDNDTIIK